VPIDTFEVVVRGRLSPTLVTALKGFDVSRCTDGLTHLVGPVPDQGQLNIELVSVNPVGAAVCD
jgi:hypothetical protein